MGRLPSALGCGFAYSVTRMPRQTFIPPAIILYFSAKDNCFLWGLGGNYRAVGDKDALWRLLTLFQLDRNQDKKSCLFPMRGLCKEILLKYPRQIQNPRKIPSFFLTGGLYRKIFPSDPHFLHITGYKRTIFLYRPQTTQEQGTHHHSPTQKGVQNHFFYI